MAVTKPFMHLLCVLAKLPNLELQNVPKQLLGSLALPAVSCFIAKEPRQEVQPLLLLRAFVLITFKIELFFIVGLVATISLAMVLRYGFRLIGLTSGYKHQ
jgi:hypothetical protein